MILAAAVPGIFSPELKKAVKEVVAFQIFGIAMVVLAILVLAYFNIKIYRNSKKSNEIQ